MRCADHTEVGSSLIFIKIIKTGKWDQKIKKSAGSACTYDSQLINAKILIKSHKVAYSLHVKCIAHVNLWMKKKSFAGNSH